MTADQQRMGAALKSLTEAGIACVFGLTGSTGVIEDDLNDYLRAGDPEGGHRLTARWTGTHVGAREHGGAYWDAPGVLRYRFNDAPVTDLYWAWNHHVRDLGEEIERAFSDAGLVTSWSGDTDSVVVILGGA